MSPFKSSTFDPKRSISIPCRRAGAAGEFAKGFWLCTQSFGWMQQLSELHVAEQLSLRLDSLYTEMIGQLGLALQSACIHFRAESYEEVIFKHPSQPTTAYSSQPKLQIVKQAGSNPYTASSAGLFRHWLILAA